ncbi:hypothetical protein CQ10_29565 [Bradyrhizobium valentinum]|uniref:Uncharacterized protein n=1 Tax=Bradyrhizobium valentinum TaxID=1518501 RepID=A0A0R3KIY2_9BRAD|nr:hypothetical protein CP49_33015 [Bradyrhizobium valentinum]KRQ97010.1 hypothetical protein CQ10_29565 [Bradyrhizobium valentinum]
MSGQVAVLTIWPDTSAVRRRRLVRTARRQRRATATGQAAPAHRQARGGRCSYVPTACVGAAYLSVARLIYIKRMALEFRCMLWRQQIGSLK